MSDQPGFKPILILVLLGAVFYIPFLGNVHLFDWDEINFAEASREMLLTGDYSRVYIDYIPFWEKPPLFFWIQSLSMNMFGVNEFAARFPNALVGIATLVTVFLTGRKIYDTSFGWIWSLSFFASILPLVYFKSGIIDPLFNLLIFLGLYFYITAGWHKEEERTGKMWPGLLLAGIFGGLAILTKGQAAAVIAILVLCVHFVYNHFKSRLALISIIFTAAIAMLITFSWAAWETFNNGPWFIREFTEYQFRLLTTPDAGHGGFPGFHLVVLFFGCFPASIFAIRSFFKMSGDENSHQTDFRKWMKVFFWVVLFVFSVVESKIIHYSSLCYFPITYLSAVVIHKFLNSDFTILRINKLLYATGILIAAVVIIVAFLGNNIPLLRSWLENDQFIYESLGAEVSWSGWEFIPALILLLSMAGYFIFHTIDRARKAFLTLFLGCGIFALSALIFFVKRVEGYSQRTAIEMIKELSDEDCYLLNAGYKSYATLFYFKKGPEHSPSFKSKREKTNWLLFGELDKPLYLITRIDRVKETDRYIKAAEVKRKNGWILLKKIK